MKVSVYLSLENFNNRKAVYSAIVCDVDSFDYSSALRFFRSVYGDGIYVDFLVG